MSEVEPALPKSFIFKSNDTFWILVYDFLLVSNSNIWPKVALVRDKSFITWDIDLPMSHKDKI